MEQTYVNFGNNVLGQLTCMSEGSFGFLEQGFSWACLLKKHLLPLLPLSGVRTARFLRIFLFLRTLVLYLWHVFYRLASQTMQDLQLAYTVTNEPYSLNHKYLGIRTFNVEHAAWRYQVSPNICPRRRRWWWWWGARHSIGRLTKSN